MKLSEAPSFLSVFALRTELERFTYRPGWVLTIEEDPFEGPFLFVECVVPNGYRPDEPLRLGVRSNIPPIPDAQYFGVWLSWRMRQMEIHESMEYLHRDGKPWRDPHDVIEPDGLPCTD